MTLFDCDLERIKFTYYTFDLINGEFKINSIESILTKYNQITNISFSIRRDPFKITYTNFEFIGRQDIRIENPNEEVGRFYVDALKELKANFRENELVQEVQLERNKVNEKPRYKIFISHSSKDKAIIDKFTDKVLHLQLGLRNSEVFCSSIEGLGIKTGIDFIEKIKEELFDSNLVIIFISSSYKQSEICLNEMGAAWVLGKRVITIIIPPVNYRNVGLLHMNKLLDRIDSGSGIDNILMSIQKHLDITLDGNIARWNKHRDDLLTFVKKKVSKRRKK